MKLPLYILGALLLVPVVQARLTETEDELVQRFGKVKTRTEERKSFEGRTFTIGPELRFVSDQWKISAVMIDGRCAQITYTKVGHWTEEQLVGMLERNGGFATYTEDKTKSSKVVRRWKQRDGTTAEFILNKFTLTHPAFERQLAVLKAKAEAESKRPPKF
jgi:hypothetical protein